MDSDKHSVWVEKYRPQTLNDYIFHDENQRVAIERMVADGSIPHLLLTGVQGTGKTTLVKILIRELGIEDVDLLTMNGSEQNSVEDMRGDIKSFISTFAMGDFKVVHIEEADYLSPNAQGILRAFFEDYVDNVRFIFSCNYENRIIPPIRSRFQHFRFQKHDIDDVTENVANILIQERIKFNLELLDKYIKTGYPDIRKIINLLQQNSKTGTLLPMAEQGQEAGDYKFQLLEHIQVDDWFAARKLACDQVAPEEWEDVYRFLYENLHEAPKFSAQDNWEAGIVIIADHLYKHSIVADPEINAAAMFIRLTQI